MENDGDQAWLESWFAPQLMGWFYGGVRLLRAAALYDAHGDIDPK
jgi:hypothetical protein